MIQLKIISPLKEILSAEAEQVELPGTLGRFVVLTGHAPLISTLGEGAIRYTEDSQNFEIPCREGFVEVRNNTVTVCLG